jgi:hypothetical protein
VRKSPFRFWRKADMPKNAIDVAIGGKADMAYCSANVRFMTHSGHSSRGVKTYLRCEYKKARPRRQLSGVFHREYLMMIRMT